MFINSMSRMPQDQFLLRLHRELFRHQKDAAPTLFGPGLDAGIEQRRFAAAGHGLQSDIYGCCCFAYFIIGFSLISAARSSLSVFVAYFTKIIPHLKRFLNNIVSNFSKNCLPNSGHCFVQVDIRVQNGRAEKAELPAAAYRRGTGSFGWRNMRFL